MPFLFSCSKRIVTFVQTCRTARTPPMDILQMTTQAAVPPQEGKDAYAVSCTHLQGNKATPSYTFLNLVTPYASAPASDSVLCTAMLARELDTNRGGTPSSFSHLCCLPQTSVHIFLLPQSYHIVDCHMPTLLSAGGSPRS